GEGYGRRTDAREAVERVQSMAEDAGIDADERPSFEIYEDSAGEHRWRLVAANGESVADSGEGYTRRADAREAAERVGRYAPEAGRITVGEAAVEL
ncbi:MAG: YegP family protein, partial [Halobaculum sp.]